MGGLVTGCKDTCSLDGVNKLNGYETVADSEWAEAVRSGNLEGMQYILLEDSEWLNSPIDSQGRKALHWCIKNQSTMEILYCLLTEGANVNEKAGRDEDTPLHEACQINNIECICLLLRFGANPSLANRQRKIPSEICEVGIKQDIFETNRIQYIQSLGRPKSYHTINDDLYRQSSSSFSASSSSSSSSSFPRSSSSSSSLTAVRTYVIQITPPSPSTSMNTISNHSHSSHHHDNANNNKIIDDQDDGNDDDNNNNDDDNKLSVYYSNYNNSKKRKKKKQWSINAFAQEIGMEWIEVVQFFKSPKNTNIMEAIWNRVIQDPTQQKLKNCDAQLLKLIYAAIFSAVKIQRRNQSSIPKPFVYKIMKRIKKELKVHSSSSSSSSYLHSQTNKDYELTKHQFIFEFANLLEKLPHSSF